VRVLLLRLHFSPREAARFTSHDPQHVTTQDEVTGADARANELPHGWCDIVGRGRMGGALASALENAGVPIRGPLGRDEDSSDAALVLLCVPDREIAAAAAAIPPGPIVGHVSASGSLSLLEPHERFALHPLLSVASAGATFAGATCAVDGSTPRALAVAEELARRLGMRSFMVPAEKRALYHAAASMASNYLTTIESVAERLAKEVGLDRAALIPLVRGAVEQWASLGARAALTGPIARGDEETVARQRAAVAEAAPDLLALWDGLADVTRKLAASSDPATT
jgi:predicted short-subunit dehydrogenase-like oxidoreductase (DUF2520 family)